MRRTLIALTGLAMLVPAPASARPEYQARIPHGACDRCHIVPGGPRNPFGLDVQRLRPNWQSLYDLDSDGDGFTNGQELGDPYGEWPGQSAGPMLSEPGDAGSFPQPVGTPPEAEDAAFTIDEDELLEDMFDATDADGDTLRFRLGATPQLGELDFIDAQTGAFTYTPDPGVAGTDMFTIRVSDGHNLAVEADVTITIRPVNDAPIIDVNDHYRVTEGRTLAFRPEATDEEDGPVAVELTSNLPDGATWADERFEWEPGARQAGDYVVSFAARDSEGASTEVDVSIEVIDRNAPPIIESVTAPETASEGDPLHFSVVASDGDGDELTYTWNIPGADPREGTDLTELDHTFGDDGRMTVIVSVTDGIDRADERFVVEVENIPPTVEAGEDRALSVGVEALFEGSFSDPGDEEYRTRWNFGDGTALVNDTLTPTHTFARAGTFTVVFSVEDNRARIDDVLKVTVTDDGDNNGVTPGNNGTMPGNNGANNGASTCYVGQIRTCVCPDGRFSQAVCDGTGTYPPCECGGAGAQGDEGCQTESGSPLAPLWRGLRQVVLRR